MDKTGLPKVFFDSMFLDFFKEYNDSLVKSITTVKPNKQAHMPLQPTQKASSPASAEQDQAKIAILLKKLEEKDSQIAALSSKPAMGNTISPVSATGELGLLKATVNSLQRTIQEQAKKYQELEQEQEDLLLCLADQASEMDNLRSLLIEFGHVFEDE